VLRRTVLPTFSVTSAAAAGTSVLQVIDGLARFDAFTIDALVQGATGGTLDLYLQRLVDSSGPGVWFDWARIAQLAAGAAAKAYSLGFDTGAAAPAITNVGQFTTAGAGTAVLAAGSIAPVHPGDQLRVVGVAGAGTSAGAALSFYVSGFSRFS
jgi:hypothetical protein